MIRKSVKRFSEKIMPKQECGRSTRSRSAFALYDGEVAASAAGMDAQSRKSPLK
jgi:hypothetical protein